MLVGANPPYYSTFLCHTSFCNLPGQAVLIAADNFGSEVSIHPIVCVYRVLVYEGFLLLFLIVAGVFTPMPVDIKLEFLIFLSMAPTTARRSNYPKKTSCCQNRYGF